MKEKLRVKNREIDNSVFLRKWPREREAHSHTKTCSKYVFTETSFITAVVGVLSHWDKILEGNQLEGRKIFFFFLALGFKGLSWLLTGSFAFRLIMRPRTVATQGGGNAYLVVTMKQKDMVAFIASHSKTLQINHWMNPLMLQYPSLDPVQAAMIWLGR